MRLLAAEPDGPQGFVDQLGSLVEGDANWAQEPGGALAFLLCLTAAAALTAAIAFHPTRWKAGRARPKRYLRNAQTQILVGVAGALLVLVIGGSVARAFGLVGLGSFIRFRHAVQDPVDTALMFLLLAIGMACGVGMLLHALAGTLFLWTLLWLFPIHDKENA